MSGKCHLQACPNLVWLVPGVWLVNGKWGRMQQKVSLYIKCFTGFLSELTGCSEFTSLVERD
jgi:hypothetical protein